MVIALREEHPDVVIVGAGVIGLSVAVSLAQRSSLRILVLEKGVGLGEGSTGASSAVCRFRYSKSEMMELARDGIAAYRNWADYVGLSAPAAHYHRLGNVWMGSDENSYEGDVSRLRACGVDAHYLDDEELAERYPAVNISRYGPDFDPDNARACRGGARHLFEADAGYIEPVDVITDLLAAARENSVEVRFQQSVDRILHRSGSATGVRLQDGSEIQAGVVLNAAGPWSKFLFERSDVPCDWPLRPTRIQMVQIYRPAAMKGPLPVCADPAGGIYFRPAQNNQQIIVGSLLEEDERDHIEVPDSFARYADDDFMRLKLHALHHRLPALDYRLPVHGYSGLYTINTVDVHPVVGETDITGLYAANGFSGHGFKLAPAIASWLAAQISGISSVTDTTADVSVLGYNRAPIDVASRSVIA